MKYALTLLALVIASPANACDCYAPDYIDQRNGDLYPVKVKGTKAYVWTGWSDYDAEVKRICARRGSKCR